MKVLKDSSANQSIPGKNGKQIGYDKIFNQYGPALYSTIYTILKDELLSYKVLECTLLIIEKKLNVEYSSVKNGFVQINNLTRNLALSINSLVSYNKSIPGKFSSLSYNKCSHLLPPQLRNIVELHFIRGLSIDQIAQILNLTPGNVNDKMNQGIELIERFSVERVSITNPVIEEIM